MTYADRLLAASAKREEDGAKVVELIVRGLERSEAEAKELFDILTKLNWNRKVTREQWDYITGFRCGVFLAGWNAPDKFDYPYLDNDQPNLAILDDYKPLNTEGMLDTFDGVVAWAKANGAWGVSMSNVYTGVLLKLEGPGQNVNQICRFGWHHKLKGWLLEQWVWSCFGSPADDSTMIPIEKASAWWAEWSNRPGCESR